MEEFVLRILILFLAVPVMSIPVFILLAFFPEPPHADVYDMEMEDLYDD